VTTDTLGAIYFILNYNSTRDVYPGPEEYLISTNGTFNMVLVKYNTNGLFEWAIPLGSEENDDVHVLTVDAAQNIIIGGSIFQPADFDPGPNEAIETPGNPEAYSVFLAKYSPAGEYVWSFITDIIDEVNGVSSSTPFALNTDSTDEIVSTGFRVFPNPTSDYFYIENPTNQSLFPWFLFDVNGRQVLNGQDSKIDIRHLRDGVYFLKLEGRTYNEVFKILKH